VRDLYLTPERPLPWAALPSTIGCWSAGDLRVNGAVALDLARRSGALLSPASVHGAAALAE
jgi:hypothetical protein